MSQTYCFWQVGGWGGGGGGFTLALPSGRSCPSSFLLLLIQYILDKLCKVPVYDNFWILLQGSENSPVFKSSENKDR